MNMKLKLSYKDGKTFIEVDGETMRVPEAILKYPSVNKEIVQYAQNAKKFSQIKLEHSEQGALANGLLISEKDSDFILSYLNGVELDTETKKFSTAVQPDFSISDYDLVGSEYYSLENWYRKGWYNQPGSYMLVNKYDANLCIQPKMEHTGLFDLSGEFWLELLYKGGCKATFIDPYPYVHSTHDPLKVVNKYWDSLFEKRDLVRLKTELLLERYTHYKLKLRYKNGKTEVEINGEWMSVAKAVLHPTAGKEILKCQKELREYSKKAKELSQINIGYCSKWVEESYNPYLASNHVVFCVNGKEVSRVSDEYVNLDKIESPSKRDYAKIQKVLGVSESEIDKIDWNGTYFANGKPISAKDCNFVRSYLNGAEFDTGTKKFSTAVQPNFDFDDFEYNDAIGWAHKTCKNLRINTGYENVDRGDYDGLYLTLTSRHLCGKKEFFKDAYWDYHDYVGGVRYAIKEHWDSYISEQDKNTLCDIKLDAILTEFSNEKTKNDELGS